MIPALLALAALGAPVAHARPDNKALDQTLVAKCAGVKEGDIVLVESGMANRDLLERIAANVSAAKEVTITHANGTNLSMKIQGCTPHAPTA